MVTKMEEEKSKMVQKIAELEAEIRKKQQMAAALQKKSREEKVQHYIKCIIIIIYASMYV